MLVVSVASLTGNVVAHPGKVLEKNSPKRPTTSAIYRPSKINAVQGSLPLKWANCRWASGSWGQVKSSFNTPVMQRTGRIRKQRGWYAHKRFRSHPVPPDVAPVGQCAGSTRLYSTKSQAWSCACVLREKAHSSAYHRSATNPSSPPLRGTVVPPPSVKSTWVSNTRKKVKIKQTHDGK
jgi:hypothetical protein